MIQHILERGRSVEKSLVISKVLGQVLPLSKHKFASNVVEKCVAFGSKADRQKLIEEVIVSKPDGSPSPLVLMMKDQFANYVVQKMLDVVDGEQRDVLVAKIKPHLPSLKKYTYGKHLITSKSYPCTMLFFFLLNIHSFIGTRSNDYQLSSNNRGGKVDGHAGATLCTR